MKAIITWPNGHTSEWVCREDKNVWINKVKNNPIILANNAKVVIVKG